MIQNLAKPAKRWRSAKHLAHVRSYRCCYCESEENIQAAHVRIGSGAGMGQKPDDWRAVSLCQDCHTLQHQMGERTFWNGVIIEAVIEAFIYTSPCKQEIAREQEARE